MGLEFQTGSPLPTFPFQNYEFYNLNGEHFSPFFPSRATTEASVSTLFCLQSLQQPSENLNWHCHMKRNKLLYTLAHGNLEQHSDFVCYLFQVTSLLHKTKILRKEFMSSNDILYITWSQTYKLKLERSMVWAGCQLRTPFQVLMS